MFLSKLNQLGSILSLAVITTSLPVLSQTATNEKEEPIAFVSAVEENTIDLLYQASSDDEQAKQKLMAKLKSITHFSAQFSQTVFDNEQNIIQKSAGDIVVSKPNKIHWQTTQPEESLIVSDGSTLWLFDPFIEQVSAFSLDNSMANTPILLLSSESDAVWSKYSIQEISTEHYKINANDEQSQVKSLNVYFNGDEILSLTIDDVTGQKSEITLSNSNYMFIPESSLFEFVVPEGVYVDDQR